MRRREHKDVLRQEAEERNAAHSTLTTMQKLKQLDMRLGMGVGAKKERSRLLKLLAEGDDSE